jgi:hypothetical protein
VYGHCDKIDTEGRIIGRVDAATVGLEELLAYATIPQPSAFLRRSALEKVGGIDVGYRYAMDYDLWLRLAVGGARFRAVDEVWAQFRIHGASKTVSETARFLPEVERAMENALRAAARLPAPRRALRARFHSNIARAAYANLDLPTARRHFARSAASDPSKVDWTTLAKSLLPLPLIRALRRG